MQQSCGESGGRVTILLGPQKQLKRTSHPPFGLPLGDEPNLSAMELKTKRVEVVGALSGSQAILGGLETDSKTKRVRKLTHETTTKQTLGPRPPPEKSGNNTNT